jgi:hypothetical protein
MCLHSLGAQPGWLSGSPLTREEKRAVLIIVGIVPSQVAWSGS